MTLKPTLDRLSFPEKLVLTYAALLPAEYVVRPWIRHLVAKEFPELGRDVEPGYRDPWEKLLGSLISLRLLQLTSEFNVVRIHRLVQELVRQQADRVWLDSLDQALIAHVKKRGEVFFTDWVNPETRWELEPLAACAGRWMGMELREREGIEIADSVAVSMLRLARYTEAEPLFRRALAIREKSLGPDHPDVANSLNGLASLLDDTNRRTEAEPLFRRALAIREKSLGPDHPSVANSLNNLAKLLYESNRRPEAEPLFRRALTSGKRAWALTILMSPPLSITWLACSMPPTGGQKLSRFIAERWPSEKRAWALTILMLPTLSMVWRNCSMLPTGSQKLSLFIAERWPSGKRAWALTILLSPILSITWLDCSMRPTGGQKLSSFITERWPSVKRAWALTISMSPMLSITWLACSMPPTGGQKLSRFFAERWPSGKRAWALTILLSPTLSITWLTCFM